jgi:hypothetical protein
VDSPDRVVKALIKDLLVINIDMVSQEKDKRTRRKPKSVLFDNSS